MSRCPHADVGSRLSTPIATALVETGPRRGSLAQPWERLPFRRPIALTLTVAILVITAVLWIRDWDLVVSQWGNDLEFFVSTASRWLATGQFYQQRQLAGPYEVAINSDVLYPPAALLLFVPFVWLPAILWWLIPIGIVSWSVARSRPSWAVWPFLALILWFPRTQSIIVWGGTSMWIAAFVALGLSSRWPAALVMIKPTLAPFALIGVRSRWWWAAGFALFALSIGMLTDYLTAMDNMEGAFATIYYSVQDFPTIAIPLVAWLARKKSLGDPESNHVDPRTSIDRSRPLDPG